MLTDQIIEEAKSLLIKTYNPLKIYIFGSYAWGQPHKDSDLDLMVIVKESSTKPLHRAKPGLLALADLEIAKEVLVLTQDEFDARCADNSTLAFMVKNHGKCIYTQS